MKTSKKGIDLIKHFEGLRLQTYKCSASKLTIGYGHTGTTKENMTITIEEAEKLLKNDLEKFESAVNRLVGIKINQLMFDSLVCFAYNVGIGNLQTSTLLKKINLNKLDEVPQEFLKWNKATVEGKLTVLNGLTKRREAEKELFLQGLKELQIQEIIGG